MQMIEPFVFYLSKQLTFAFAFKVDDFSLSPSSDQNFPSAPRGCPPKFKLTVHQ